MECVVFCFLLRGVWEKGSGRRCGKIGELVMKKMTSGMLTVGGEYAGRRGRG